MMTISRRHNEASHLVWALVIACFVMAFAMPLQAWAEVHKSDVVGGATVEERGLSVAECPSVDAQYAVLMDQDGNVIFGRMADSPSQIASITKVMTAIVAIDKAPADLHVGVSEAAAYVGESSAGLQEGDVMDFDTALKALLVPSGNDAAMALACASGPPLSLCDKVLLVSITFTYG